MTRWNRVTTQQIRTIGSKDLTGPQEFTTSEDVPNTSKLCKAVVLEMPAEPIPGPHSVVLPGQHVWAFSTLLWRLFIWIMPEWSVERIVRTASIGWVLSFLSRISLLCR